MTPGEGGKKSRVQAHDKDPRSPAGGHNGQGEKVKVTEAGQRFQISDSTGIGLRVEQQWRRKSAVAPKEELIAMSGALEATGGWASFEPPLPFGFEWKTLRRALLGWRHGQGEKEGGGREARTPALAPISGRDAKNGGKHRAHQRVRREKEAEARGEDVPRPRGEDVPRPRERGAHCNVGRIRSTG